MAELFAGDPALAGPAGASQPAPNYALLVSEELSAGWHSAVIVRDAASPYFFVRSIAASWPFVLARPRPSTRQSEVAYPREQMSPMRTTPSQKLVVNWNWEVIEGTIEHLAFFVRCRGPYFFRPKRKLIVRLGLKEQVPPQRRYSLRLVGAPIDWRPTRPLGVVPQRTSSVAGTGKLAGAYGPDRLSSEDHAHSDASSAHAASRPPA